jgi:hypothetical protein
MPFGASLKAKAPASAGAFLLLLRRLLLLVIPAKAGIPSVRYPA